jgi:hypothetical protein
MIYTDRCSKSTYVDGIVVMGMIQMAFSVQREPSRKTKEMGRKCYTRGTMQYEGNEDLGIPICSSCYRYWQREWYYHFFQRSS